MSPKGWLSRVKRLLSSPEPGQATGKRGRVESPPASPARVVLFNDTRNNPHIGCQAVADAHERMLERAGVELVDRYFNRELWEFASIRRAEDMKRALAESRFREVLSDADAVVVNGEGTIHHGQGRELLATLAVAQEMGKRTLLLNAVMEEVPDFHEVLRAVDDLTVRDARSARYLESLGIACRVLPDSVVEARFDDEPYADYSGKLLVTDWHIHVDATVGAAIRRFESETAGTTARYALQGHEPALRWRHAVADVRTATAMVSARHHGAYLAALAGIPFVLLGSNTHKMEGFIEWTELPIPFCRTASEIQAGLEFARSRAAMYFELSARLRAITPLDSFRQLEGLRRGVRREAGDSADRSQRPHAGLPVQRVLARVEVGDPETAACVLADHLPDDGAMAERELRALAFKTRDTRDLALAIARLAELRPDVAGVHLASGISWRYYGDNTRAADAYARSLELRAEASEKTPVHTLLDTHLFAALACLSAEWFDECEAHLRRAIELAPNDARPRTQLGQLHLRTARFELAVEAFEASLRFREDHAPGWFDLGYARYLAGAGPAAVEAFERCLEMDPENHDARYYLGLTEIHEGDYEKGWEHAEARWLIEPLATEKRIFDVPEWDGSMALEGRLLVWSEEAPGIGVQVMFAAFVRELRDAGLDIVFEVGERLASLVERSLPGVEVVTRADPPDPRTSRGVVAQAAAGSLARFLRRTVNDFAAARPFLTPDDAARRALRARYGTDRPLVGISWRTGNQFTGCHRTIELERWAELLSAAECRYVSLQYGDVAEEVARAQAEKGVTILVDDDIDALGNIDPFAAQVAAMDLVISIDNSTIHFAGALGVECWCLLSEPCYWQWPKAGNASLWYPSVSFVRQPEPGDWDSVFADAGLALGRWAQARV